MGLDQVGLVGSFSTFHLCGPRFESQLRTEPCILIEFSFSTFVPYKVLKLKLLSLSFLHLIGFLACTVIRPRKKRNSLAPKVSKNN